MRLGSRPRPGSARTTSPRPGWFYSWLDYDRRRRTAGLRGPGRDRASTTSGCSRSGRGSSRTGRSSASARSRTCCDTIDAAAEHGLTVAVDLIQGHLSSFDFLPSWVLTWHKASLFEDPTVRDGLTAYVETVARAVATRPNVFAITLGNEVNNLWPDSTTTLRGARPGGRRSCSTTVKKAAPDVLALHSLFDDAWYKAGPPVPPGRRRGSGRPEHCPLVGIQRGLASGRSARAGHAQPRRLPGRAGRGDLARSGPTGVAAGDRRTGAGHPGGVAGRVHPADASSTCCRTRRCGA